MPTVTVPVKELIIQLARLEDDERRVRAASAGNDPEAFERDLRRICSHEDQLIAALHELHG